MRLNKMWELLLQFTLRKFCCVHNSNTNNIESNPKLIGNSDLPPTHAHAHWLYGLPQPCWRSPCASDEESWSRVWWLERGDLCLSFVASYHFMSILNLRFNPNVPFNMNAKPDVHLIVKRPRHLRRYLGPLHLTTPPHYEHVLMSINMVTKNVLKICLHVNKASLPPFVNIGNPENYDIMKWTHKSYIQVKKQTLMRNNNCVVHTTFIFPSH